MEKEEREQFRDWYKKRKEMRIRNREPGTQATKLYERVNIHN